MYQKYKEEVPGATEEEFLEVETRRYDRVIVPAEIRAKFHEFMGANMAAYPAHLSDSVICALDLYEDLSESYVMLFQSLYEKVVYM